MIDALGFDEFIGELEEDVASMGLSESSSEPKKFGAKFVEAAPELKECGICGETLAIELFKKGKKFCSQGCQRDVDCAEKAAKIDGELQYFNLMRQQRPLDFAVFMRSWIREVGPSQGRGIRRGKFDWARYKETYFRKQGTRKGAKGVQKTYKQFIALMVEKGRDAIWADKEWARRRGSDEYESGNDPDTGLPTIEALAEIYADKFDEIGHTTSVEVGKKEIKNPKLEDLKSGIAAAMDGPPKHGDLASLLSMTAAKLSEVKDMPEETKLSAKAFANEHAADAVAEMTPGSKSSQEKSFQSPAKGLPGTAGGGAIGGGGGDGDDADAETPHSKKRIGNPNFAHVSSPPCVPAHWEIKDLRHRAPRGLENMYF
jgi:hypothetical protein